MIFGGDYSVGKIAFAGQVDVSKFVFEVETSFHFGFVVFLSAGLHYYGY
jgi:hypothetical protein